VSYELSLAPDLDRGGHIYRAELPGELEPASVLELSEWLDDAKQNPDARFVVDLSASTGAGRRARAELRALMRRHSDLSDRQRLTLLAAPRARRRVAAGGTSGGPLLKRPRSPLPF
jgi:hypothetical protein